MRAWGRLLRLSLAPTAVADIVAGAVVGAGGWPWEHDQNLRVVALVLASLSIYHGGMVLNDWADREDDRRLRPDRPIPSGAIDPRAALLAGIALVLAGPLLASRASPASAWVLSGVATAALAYDLRLRGAWIGPLLLAVCRGGNLTAGILFGAGSTFHSTALLPPILYSAYVFAVSRLGRLEDAPGEVLESSRPSRHLVVAAVLLALSPPAAVLPANVDLSWRSAAALGLAVYGAAGLVAATRRSSPWTGLEVTRATGLGLRRLLVFTAALALAAGGSAGAFAAGGILLGYPVSYALRGRFPPS